MSNDNYIINKKSVEIEPFVPAQPTPAEVKQDKPYASGHNYQVETNRPEAFSFTTSTGTIDFGKLSATNPVLRDLDMRLMSNQSYQILISEDHPLSTNNKLLIPDTTCDNGSCSEVTPSLWTNTLTYGTGYHTTSMDSDNYKQIPDSSRKETLQAAFQGQSAHNEKSTLTTKVNISGTQTIDAYTNTVSIIATPDF